MPPPSPLSSVLSARAGRRLAAPPQQRPPSRRPAALCLSLCASHPPRPAAMQPRLAAGTDAEAVAPAVAALVAPAGGRWLLAADGRALERSFRFKTFAKTWDFMTAVALQCKVHNHHPEWSNVYNTTLVRWTTHEPPGLSQTDVRMAAICDAIARDFQELDPEPCAAEEMLGRVTAEAGDCCAPKKKEPR